MAMALGAVMLITLVLLSIVSSSPHLTAEDNVSHVARHLREYLEGQSAREQPVVMEAQARRNRGHTGAIVMESQLRNPMTPMPATDNGNVHTNKPKLAMEAIPRRPEAKDTVKYAPPTPDAITAAEAKAEEAEEIANQALAVAIQAEERAQAAEAAAEMSVIAQIGAMVGQAQDGEQIAILGELEDTDSPDALASTTKQQRNW
ncbi:unnamed protein product [Phytophthora lilii]|uniref:Unnamed protein product n=1 Tax=Phytophthora lilii TaxID=2077276 RepID=A0A9W6TVG6_9STRA|nr:unnamed protein product [Phytophthora lilii]